MRINGGFNVMMQWQTQLDQLRRDHRVPITLTALFALLLLWAVSDFIGTFTAHNLNMTAIKTTIAPEHLQNLADLHLFGVYASNLDALPTTQLQLTLEGTIVILEAPAQSRALIASPNAPTKVYQVGDALPGNATITRIAKQYVVVDDNGMLEKLVLPIQTVTNSE